MAFDHLVREEDNLFECLYCGRDLERKEWISEFCGPLHYKVAKCECGKKSRVKIPYSGSGHDEFNKDKSLEFRVDTFRFHDFPVLPPPS